MSWIGAAWDWYAAHSDKINPIVAGLGGAALVWAAIRQARTATRRHYEQTRSDQQRRLTESFSKAVEQLASDKIEARLGGIYTLERLAIEAIAQVRSFFSWWRRLLLRLLHRNTLERLVIKAIAQRLLPTQHESPTPGFLGQLLALERHVDLLARSFPWWLRVLLPLLHRNTTPPADPVSDLYWTVMETLTAFVRERTRWKEPDSAKPEAAANSDLWQSQPGSDEAQLRPRPATDIAAVLEVIRRRPDAGRKLEELREWRLDLNRTDLRGADLSEAHLEHVTLFRVHLEHADLFRTHLEHAKFRVAHLEHAILREAHLEHADVMALFDEHADLRGAHLEGADLRYTEGLTQPQIDSAEGDAATQLPEGRTRPRHWTELDAT